MTRKIRRKKMAKQEFFYTINEREANATMGIDPWAIAAYLYIKRNSLFSEGISKHICYGGLAVYLGGIDRTQAKRLVQKLIKLGLLAATDTKQVYRLVFCSNQKNDTITSDTLNTSDKKDKTSYINARTREDDDFSNSGKQKEKITANKTFTTQTTDKGADAPVKAATPPSILEREGLGAETTEAAQIKAHAKAEGWKFWDNPKSLPYFQKAGEASKKLAQPLPYLLTEYQSEASETTAMGFKIFVDDYKKTHSQNQSQRRGDLVL